MTDARTCDHPAAHVHGLVGAGPVEVPPEDSRLNLTPVEWGHLTSPLRQGERMSAAIGECASCASLVVSVSTWHRSDGHGEHAVQYQTRWVPLFSARDQDVPAAADPAVRGPLPATLVDATTGADRGRPDAPRLT